MILLTGSHGFIGSHLRRALRGHDLVCVDPRLPGSPPIEVALQSEYEAVFHLGAISDTTCEDGFALMTVNVDLTVRLKRFCDLRGIPFIWASSAAVYGNGQDPLNKYGWSKLEAEEVIQARFADGQWYGLRFFNVYGPGEAHKGKQASIVSRLLDGSLTEVFEPQTKRDFIHVDDVVSVMLWCWKHRPPSGIYDVGTGQPRSIHEVMKIAGAKCALVPMPESLKGKYQFHTKADLTKLREAGYDKRFLTLEEGVARMA